MSQVFPAHWDVLPFSLAVKDATSEYSKLQKSEYLEQGRFPIVDQGQQKFGGYTDDESVVSLDGCPAIVFGDHTRIFKFIDEPFCLGADGAKVLEPKAELDKKFLFYYLSSLNIESAGYSRHFKFLKENVVPVPPLPEQKRIAAILDKADAIRRKRQQAIQLADDFLRAVFLDMFGDPVTNPKGWEVRLSGELFSVPPRIGTTTPADGQGCLVVRVGEIGKQDINFSKCGRAQLKDSELERFILRSGDTVLARAIGSKRQLGKASFFSGYSESVYIDSHVMRLRPNVKICNPEWFYRFISSDGGKSLLQKAGGETAVQFNINAKQAASLLIPLPPIELQNEFIAFCQKYSKNKAHLSRQAGDFEVLFSSLSQKAFSGQL